MLQIKLGNFTQGVKLLIMSDLHVGDPRVEERHVDLLCTVIKLEKPDVLILAGDVLEENLATEDQKRRLMAACAVAKHVIVLKGNHDSKATQRLAYTIEATFGECVVGYSGGKAYAVEHGNRFDSWWKKVPGLGRLAIWFNRVVYRITKFDLQAWFRQFEFVKKSLLKQHEKAQKAWPDCDTVVTGHTHMPEGTPLKVGYFNSGDWMYHKTYVVINNGYARLEYLQ